MHVAFDLLVHIFHHLEDRVRVLLCLRPLIRRLAGEQRSGRRDCTSRLDFLFTARVKAMAPPRHHVHEAIHVTQLILRSHSVLGSGVEVQGVQGILSRTQRSRRTLENF